MGFLSVFNKFSLPFSTGTTFVYFLFELPSFFPWFAIVLEKKEKQGNNNNQNIAAACIIPICII